MFDSVTLRGDRASLLWGYRPAAVLTSWSITGRDGKWTLTGTFASADAFQCQRAAQLKELLFTAPEAWGRSCWEVTAVELGTNHLRATLGQPLQ